METRGVLPFLKLDSSRRIHNTGLGMHFKTHRWRIIEIKHTDCYSEMPFQVFLILGPISLGARGFVHMHRIFKGLCGKNKQFAVWSGEQNKTSSLCWLSGMLFQMLFNTQAEKVRLCRPASHKLGEGQECWPHARPSERRISISYFFIALLGKSLTSSFSAVGRELG